MTATTHAPLLCQDDAARRGRVRGARLTGLDHVEVDCSQTQLTVNFLGAVPDWITPAHLRVEGGRRIRDIRVQRVVIQPSGSEDLDDQLIVTVDKPGDFSHYRLCLVDLDEAGRPTGRTPPGFDVRYTCAGFSFKTDCPSDLDCATAPMCPPEPLPEPAIDYLAKDFASFRRLLLDRMALVMPGWTEHHVPDIGITLIELLSYVGDNLSYQQDAVATEAYLGTARQRISVRRHARLMDYRLHEGNNARAWLVCELDDETLTLDPENFYAITRHPKHDAPLLNETDLPLIDPAPFLAFEPRVPAGTGSIVLRRARNRIRLHDWGEASCCVPKGSTAATLVDPGRVPDIPGTPDDPQQCPAPGEPTGPDVEAVVANGQWHLLKLAACDTLIFEEVLGPRTGDPADADPTHRHAVRLTSATPSWDPLTRQLLYEVSWCIDDALPFALCLSSTSDAPHCTDLLDVSVAWGNVLLVDHGQEMTSESLGSVPVAKSVETCEDVCTPSEVSRHAGRYRPRLSRTDITFATPLPPCPGNASTKDCSACGDTSASASLGQDVLAALPEIQLESRPVSAAAAALPRHWSPRLDLLDSRPDDRHFVVEVDDDRVAWLRFGDGECGAAPEAGEVFVARYRVGNGTRGLVGAEALAQLVFRDALPDGSGLRVRNPMAARGAADPEDTAQARLRIPQVFKRRIERAVTPGDYAEIVLRDFSSRVQRAAAMMRADGVGTVIQVAIDARGQAEPDAALLRCIGDHLECVRLIGHDVHVGAAQSVPLDILLHICVKPGYLRAHVKAALLAALGSGRVGPRQEPAFFHPDALALGESVSLSRLVAAAQAVDGVSGVVPMRVRRLFDGDAGELERGWLTIGPMEVARLDNDPNQPENGRLTLELEGGR